MDIPVGTKDKKRRFFRKTGSGSSSSSSRSGGQNSWESPSATQSAMSSLNTSFEGIPMTGVSSGTLNNLNFPRGTNPPTNGTVRKPQNIDHYHRPGNSVSLDEGEEVNHEHHRRFTAAPRRARSAERFDGMRINNYSPGEKLVRYPLPTREELLDRSKFTTPRPMTLGSNMVNDPRRNPLPATISSPPPPYQAAVNEKTGPPSYRQAIAAAAAKNQKIGIPKGRPLPLVHQYHRGAHSLDTEFGSSGTTMRSAISVPAFSNDVICCSCSKCQIQNKLSDDTRYGSVEDYNDSAVYMESQAFLMHEIMTDGMAFCTIV